MRSLIRMSAAVVVLLYIPKSARSSTWSQSKSSHFVLYSENQSAQEDHTLQLLERSHRLFLTLGVLNPVREHPITVFAFKDGDSFRRYAPPHSAGFFQQGESADYIGLLDQRSEVVLHEYAHAAIATVWPSLPAWINEGLAEYYSTAKWASNRLTVGGYLRSLGGAFDSLSPKLLSSLIDAQHTLIDDDARASSQRYLLSWALVDMMMTQPGYAQNFRGFLDALSGGTSVTDALQHTYGRTLAQIEDDLGKHLQREHFASVQYPYNPDSGEDELREVHSAANELEVELRLADLQSYNPSATSTARVRLEQLSALYPENPVIEERLAALSWRIGDKAGLRAHMTKAYQRGSNNAELLIADAQLELKSDTPQGQIVPLLERALAEKPDSYLARTLLGYLVYRNNDYVRARSLLKPIEEIEDPNAFLVLGSLAYCAARTEDYSSASTYAIKALAKARSDADRTAMTNLLRWITPRVPLSAEADSTTATLLSFAGSPTHNVNAYKARSRSASFQPIRSPGINTPPVPVRSSTHE